MSNNSSNLSAWDRVNLARASDRPNAQRYIKDIFEDFIELHGDRLYGDDPSIIGGIALFDGRPVTVIAQAKGENTKENIRRNFGMPHPEGYRKALRLMKQAEKFKRPVICFVDTQGAFCGKAAEERGQGEAIAKNLYEMMTLRVPVLSIVISEGGSGGALALAVANEVWMLENAIYSILSPEGFASILWKDATKAKEASEVMKITALDLKEFKIIDEIINEPEGGAQKSPDRVTKELKYKIKEFIQKYSSINDKALIEHRYNRFRKIGRYLEI